MPTVKATVEPQAGCSLPLRRQRRFEQRNEKIPGKHACSEHVQNMRIVIDPHNEDVFCRCMLRDAIEFLGFSVCSFSASAPNKRYSWASCCQPVAFLDTCFHLQAPRERGGRACADCCPRGARCALGSSTKQQDGGFILEIDDSISASI
jgi:hypothetical protein